MTPTEIRELVDHLRAQGVRSFEGAGIRVDFDPRPRPAVEAMPMRPDPHFPAADPDLFGHEAH